VSYNNGTIIGFRLLIDGEGNLVSEKTELPDKDIAKVFRTKGDQYIVRTAIRKAKNRLDKMHGEIEAEIAATNTPNILKY
tara:strand:- start:279 stop:518 length:240 start_codon:yes stop_codon:yes gene_type:complete